MRKITQDIMKIAKCDEQRAYDIENKMAEEGFDFSECTQRQFVKEVKFFAKVQKEFIAQITGK